jgi:alkylhydroperoxidase/carboxymuconolactone decarboxylase family protein YurZ
VYNVPPHDSAPIVYDTSTLDNPAVATSIDGEITPNMGINDMVMRKWDIVRAAPEQKEPPNRVVNVGPTAIVRRGYLLGHVDATMAARMRRGPSPRIEAVQQRSAAAISSHVRQLDPAAFESLRKVSKRVPAATVMAISRRVVVASIEYFGRNIPRSLRELVNVASAHALIATVESIVMDADVGAANPEHVVTWLAGVDALVRGYVRYLQEGIARSNTREKLFREKSDAELDVAVMSILSAAVEAAASRAFDPDRDVFDTVAAKDALMTASRRPY